MKYYSKLSDFTMDNPGLTTKTWIIDEDSLTFAKRFDNPCILNFASHKRPGGGYESVIGLRMIIKTQEEDLFRRSNLPELMDNADVRKNYPLKKLECLYCRATATKDRLLDDIEPFEFGLITMPAVVNPRLEDYKYLIKQKIEMIFNIAIQQGHKNLILGAWGCGIFNNDPDKIADLFMQEASRRKGYLETVGFAVPGAGSHNYRAFSQRCTGV